MESGLKSLSKIFTERVFRIPDYQRGYSWQAKQLRDFWNDVDQIEGVHKHYLGVLTLESTPDKNWERWPDDGWLITAKNYAPFYVVDGQQRLTSIIILIQCISEKLKSEQKLNYDSKHDIVAKYIYINKDARDGSYLFGYEKDNPSYEYLKTKILNRVSSRYSAGESTIYTKNLLNAKDFFREKVKDLSLKQLEVLYTKITQQLLFNVFHIEGDVDVHVAFETMNNRGLQLSNLELLKNRLIYLTTRMGEGERNTEDLRRAINNAWKTVYFYLGKNSAASLSDDYFLTIHFAIYFGPHLAISHPKLLDVSIRALAHDDFYKRFLLEEYFTIKRIYSVKAEDKLSSTNLYNYAIDLKRVVQDYYFICFPDEADFDESLKIWYRRLRRLVDTGGAQEISVILLHFGSNISDVSVREEFLKTLEEYFFLKSILPYRFVQKHNGFKLFKEFVSLSRKRSGPADLHKLLREHIAQLRAAPNFTECVLEGMIDSGFYGWQDLKYFMFEYETEIKENAKRKTEKIDWKEFVGEEEDEDQSSIEHILPQTATDPYWKNQLAGLNPKQVKKLTNSLGNLVATSARRNSSFRNLNFAAKKGDSRKKTGYAYGSYSEIEVSQNADWGPSEILQRGLRLLDFLEKRWKINLGDHVNRKKLLGLDFLPD